MKGKPISRRRQREKFVINAFVERYNRFQSLRYRIVEWPDEDKKGEQQGETIDAVARAEGGPDLAIEHTHALAARRQLEEAANFEAFKECLERGLEEPFPFYVSLTLFGDHLYRGTQRKANANLICEWLKAKGADLPSGRSDFPVVPGAVQIAIWKDESRAGFEVMRWIRRPPPNRGHLVKSFVKALQHKTTSLGQYFGSGAETILLVQSNDVALLAPGLLYQAFQQACSLTHTGHLSQVWLVHTHGRNDLTRIFCFRGPTTLMSAANPVEFHKFIENQGIL